MNLKNELTKIVSLRTVIFMVCAFALFYQCYTVINEYYEYEVRTVVELEANVGETIELPYVYLCSHYRDIIDWNKLAPNHPYQSLRESESDHIWIGEKLTYKQLNRLIATNDQIFGNKSYFLDVSRYEPEYQLLFKSCNLTRLLDNRQFCIQFKCGRFMQRQATSLSHLVHPYKNVFLYLNLTTFTKVAHPKHLYVEITKRSAPISFTKNSFNRFTYEKF